MCNCTVSNELLLKVWIYGLVRFVFHWSQKDKGNRWQFILSVNGQLGAEQQKDTTDKRSVLFFLLFRIVLPTPGHLLGPSGLKVYIPLLWIVLLERGNCQAGKREKVTELCFVVRLLFTSPCCLFCSVHTISITISTAETVNPSEKKSINMIKRCRIVLTISSSLFFFLFTLS